MSPLEDPPIQAPTVIELYFLRFPWPPVLLLMLASIVCALLLWRVAAAVRGNLLLATVLALIALPCLLGLAWSFRDFSMSIEHTFSSVTHGPIADTDFAEPWIEGLIPVLIGLVASLPGYLLAIVVLCKRALLR